MNDMAQPPSPAEGRRDPTRFRRWALAVAALVLVVSGCSSDDGSAGSSTSATSTTTAASSTALSTTTGDTSTTAPEAQADVAASGTYAVGFREFDLVDESRDTPANGDAPASEGRKLPTLAFYPAADAPGDDPAAADNAAEGAELRDGRYPLLVFSHGVTGRATFYRGELAAMASAGYVVIAPDYPLSNADSPGGPTISDVGNQPADASFLIDTFTGDDGPAADDAPDAEEGSTSEVGSHIDAERIGAVGHSLGAITSLGLGYAECCIDERVDAVAAWAGVLLGLQDGANPADGITDRPLLLVHGDDDGTVPYDSSKGAFDVIDSPRWFITLPGAGHVPPYLSPSHDAQSELTTTATIDFFDAELKADATGIDRMDQDVADAGKDVATIASAGQ